MTNRRFPAPWRADKLPGGYVVRDANGQALVYLYSRESEAESDASQGADGGRGAADCHQRCQAAGTIETRGLIMTKGPANPIDKHVGSRVRMRRLMLDKSPFSNHVSPPRRRRQSQALRVLRNLDPRPVVMLFGGVRTPRCIDRM
jgi:hypothetical protein